MQENYIEDRQNVVLQRYFGLMFTYHLRHVGAVAARRAGVGNGNSKSRF